MGVAPNVTTWFYSLANFNFWNDLTTWTGELDDETNPPYVNSVSYGSQGNYPTDSYRTRLNAEFQKLGSRGLSIIFASGDDGAGCQSGGGFSQYFAIPDYQSSDVQSYLSSGVQLPESCAYNASGRGTPDASALGDEYFQVVNGGSVIQVGGTSAATPTFSAIISLLNDQQLNNNNAVLGFLNPWLYQTASQSSTAFFDVVVGDNVSPNCCSSGAESGFLTAPGWDPVTGVGTPNFKVLSSLL